MNLTRKQWLDLDLQVRNEVFPTLESDTLNRVWFTSYLPRFIRENRVTPEIFQKLDITTLQKLNELYNINYDETGFIKDNTFHDFEEEKVEEENTVEEVTNNITRIHSEAYDKLTNATENPAPATEALKDMMQDRSEDSEDFDFSEVEDSNEDSYVYQETKNSLFDNIKLFVIEHPLVILAAAAVVVLTLLFI